MSILAIDFGLKRLGLAVSQGFIASPYQVLPNDQKIFSRLAKICSQVEAAKIIIGLPEGKLAGHVLKFGSNCQKKLGIKVEFEDEILTTKTGQKLLIESGKGAKLRKKILDAASAAVILQQYLDRKK